MHLEIRDADGKKKYYLSHSYRDNGKVKKFRAYLGENLTEAQIRSATPSAKARIEKMSERRSMSIKAYATIAAVAAVVLVAAILLLQTGTNVSGNVIISLTDPANVPAGTQSLTMSWSGLQVHTVGAGNGAWTSVTSTGSVNLLSLSNSSIILGGLSEPNGTTVNEVGFNVSSVTIEINNTVYPVIVPNKRIIANVSGSQDINGTVKVLMDLSPTIIDVVTANSTIFIMVPSIRAVIVPTSSGIAHVVGAVKGLDRDELQELDRITPNITITSASLMTVGNTTNVRVTVKDNSNQSLTLQHVMIIGNQTIQFPILNHTIPHILGNVTGGEATGGEEGVAFPNGSITGGDNASVTAHVVLGINKYDMSAYQRYDDNTETLPNGVEVSKDILQNVEDEARFKVINFQVAQNGTLFLPYFRCLSIQNRGSKSEIPTIHSVCPDFVNYSEFQNGYNLTSSNSVTLTFTGHISLGQGNLLVNIISGDSYKIVVQGTNGARAETNITAT